MILAILSSEIVSVYKIAQYKTLAARTLFNFVSSRADDCSSGIKCQLTVEPADVLHGDLRVPPHGRHDGVQRLAAQTARRHAQVPAVGAEGQRALVHVQHHQQPVRHQELLVGPQQRRVRAAAAARPLRVVEHLQPTTTDQI